MEELAGNAASLLSPEIYRMQTSLLLKFLLRIATGNPHPHGAAPYHFIPNKKPNLVVGCFIWRSWRVLPPRASVNVAEVTTGLVCLKFL